MYSCSFHDDISTRDVYNKSLRLYLQTDFIPNIFPRRKYATSYCNPIAMPVQ